MHPTGTTYKVISVEKQRLSNPHLSYDPPRCGPVPLARQSWRQSSTTGTRRLSMCRTTRARPAPSWRGSLTAPDSGRNWSSWTDRRGRRRWRLWPPSLEASSNLASLRRSPMLRSEQQVWMHRAPRVRGKQLLVTTELPPPPQQQGARRQNYQRGVPSTPGSTWSPTPPAWRCTPSRQGRGSEVAASSPSRNRD